jgi:hypothetical protein
MVLLTRITKAQCLDTLLTAKAALYDETIWKDLGLVLIIASSAPNKLVASKVYDLLMETIWDKSFICHRDHFHMDLEDFDKCIVTSLNEVYHIIDTTRKSLEQE